MTTTTIKNNTRTSSWKSTSENHIWNGTIRNRFLKIMFLNC